MILTHFYTIVSGGPKYEFQAEVFVRSLERWGKIPFTLTICQAETETLSSNYLRKRAEVVKYTPGSSPAWYGGLSECPTRGDVTVYADTDMLVVQDLSPFVTECHKRQAACGVIAYQSPFSESSGWDRLFTGCGLPRPETSYTTFRDNRKVPFYVNLGFVAVPSSLISSLNKGMKEFLQAADRILPNHYHRPQFAMCLSLANERVKCWDAPLKFNCPDLYGDVCENVVVAHLLRTKSKVQKWSDIQSSDLPNTRMIKSILEKMNFISKTRSI